MANEVRAGQQAFLKVTEEPVFVLEIRDGNATQRYPALSGKVACVRRPTAGEDGVRHSVEFFTVEEIETLEQSQTRKLEEMSELKARLKASGQAINEPVTATDELPKWD